MGMYPKYATTLVFELWEGQYFDHYAKAYYNNEELDLHHFCYGINAEEDMSCDIDTFEDKIGYGLVDLREVCYPKTFEL